MNHGDPEVLITEEEIRKRVEAFAEQISHDYAGKGELVLIGVLKGAFILLADLSRKLTIPHRVEFIAVSSYGKSSVSTGAVRMIMDLRGDIENKHVLIVEDIVDTGHTLHYLMSLLRTRRPASLRTCALVRKSDRAEVEVHVDYLGFDIPDVWVVGYGLDYAEQHRTLPYIGVLQPPADG
ncbi:MAG: hypoxanthine phosphoribosyltransferase [Gammaproteobacteria bacterium]|nr:hypoxanthine phosphoribosyltransferase [Gammaproteobacteria bacterium]